jgi:gliding motility-associated-like protein
MLYVKSKGIRAIDFEIYDRFGKTVFTSNDMDSGWNGRVNGELLSKDVFLYKLTAYPYKSTLPIEQAGQITLIR